MRNLLGAFTSGHFPPGMSQGDFDRYWDDKLSVEDDADFHQFDNDEPPATDDDDMDEYNERPMTRQEFEDYDYWKDCEEC